MCVERSTMDNRRKEEEAEEDADYADAGGRG
jgi:hypothetical protein